MKFKIIIIILMSLIFVTGCKFDDTKNTNTNNQSMSDNIEEISMKQCKDNEIPFGDWMKIQLMGGSEDESFTFQYCVVPPKKYKQCDKIYKFPYKTAATNVPEGCICVGNECPKLICKKDEDCISMNCDKYSSPGLKEFKSYCVSGESQGICRCMCPGCK